MDLLKRRLDLARKIAEELAGTIDEEDRKALTRWLDEDGKHREEYERLREALKAGDYVWREQERGQQLVENGWNVVKSRTVRKTVRLTTWSKYVAVILLPLIVGIVLFVNIDRKGEVKTVTVTSIDPGSVKAQLELADGKKVELDYGSRFQMEEVGGIKILTSDNVVQYKGKDSLLEQASEVTYNTLTVPRGGEFALELADGTRVWLNAESKLRYPVNFTGKERRVEMTGEVYFEVAKNKEKPFVVTANGVEILVLGTRFNVSAYRQEVVTTLVEGKVRLSKGMDSVTLVPDQQGVWVDDRFEVRKVEALNYTLWKDGVFYFDDVDLETILDDMARWYNVNIFYASPALKSKKFSVEIKRYENIDEILRRIEQTKRVKFNIKDRTINVFE